MKNLSILRPSMIMAFPDYVDAAVLAANTANTYNVPSGAAFVGFSANIDFYVSYGNTGATLPTTDNVAGTASELNPTIRYIGSTKETTGITLVSGSSGQVTLSWFAPGG